MYTVYKIQFALVSKQLAECVMCYNFATVKRSANTAAHKQHRSNAIMIKIIIIHLCAAVARASAAVFVCGV